MEVGATTTKWLSPMVLRMVTIAGQDRTVSYKVSCPNVRNILAIMATDI